MPPKAKQSAKPDPKPSSDSKALVTVGDRHVVPSSRRSKRNDDGQKPTTVKALVLRNGKFGARGTGEMVQVTRLLGREKLDLLVEDMVSKKAEGAIATPFHMGISLKIVDAQCSSFLDDVAHLQDPVLFVPIIEAEWNSRIPTKDPKAQEPLKSATAVAKTVATRVHNVYMLAAAWKIVADAYHDMEAMGLPADADTKAVKEILLSDAEIRNKYIGIYHFMDQTLLKFLIERFSVLATTAPHFSRYFKIKDEDVPEEQYVFDYDALKAAGKSFIDSIILEICFPAGKYPLMFLMQLLHEGVDEAPRDAKRFPQTLWDALGDLSDAVQLFTMLETPLLDPAFAQYRSAPPEKLPGFDAWYDAMMLSLKATEDVTPFKDIIFPLAKAKKRPILEQMWKAINQMYKASTKKDVETLWGLREALNRTPQWHSIYVPGLKIGENGKAEPKRKTLAITEAGEASDGSMPELQSVSNSSEEEESDDESEEEEEDDGAETGSEYDEEHEDDIRDQLRDAMDAAHEGDLFDKDEEEEEERGKGNAFLKLLGSLRGRVFNPSPKLGGKKAPAPRNPKTGFFGKSKTGAPPKTSEQPTAAQAKGPKQATVEEVEDEDDDKPTAPKKKKKKPKKKKKTAAAGAAAGAEGDDGDDGEEETPASPAGAATTAAPTSPTPAKKAPAPKPSPAVAGITAGMSSVSLATTTETTAQSAHSYLKSEKLLDQKSKVKTTGTAAPEKTKKGGFLGKFGKMTKEEEEKVKKPKHSLFSRLSKKATNSMHQLLRTSEDETKGLASMKWETFLKLMRELGFEYDPSTAGSSVRFDPPDPKDVSITFHKPHPDPTIHPVMLREFAKKLKKSYGWSEAEFLGAASSL
ncbi:hypothetical protein MKEN_00700800 [Mycena kentingensis (nom. inval.)]|nr:hypothetical protein MKEN_00700800 [Mycena kentingensis (nom. inval.)]